MRFPSLTLAALLTGLLLQSSQATAANPPLHWTTLGTTGGPLIVASRSQPSNLLSVNGQHWLIDCGDGCVERLAAAGYQPAGVDTLFLTHLHMDHIGGVLGLIGLRWMTHAAKPLTIYGPPGTQQFVDGLIQSLQPSQRIGLGMRDHRGGQSVAKTVKVVILKGGSDMTVNGVRIQAMRNSHFDNPPGHHVQNGSQSLSYRFDDKHYSIGFTGDTGPCIGLARFFNGVDLLVSEVIDLPAVVAVINSPHTPVPVKARHVMVEHLTNHHLTPQEAGKLAAAAHAKQLVFTHLVIVGPTASIAPKLIREAHTRFKGKVTVARDLDRF